MLIINIWNIIKILLVTYRKYLYNIYCMLSRQIRFLYNNTRLWLRDNGNDGIRSEWMCYLSHIAV